MHKIGIAISDPAVSSAVCEFLQAQNCNSSFLDERNGGHLTGASEQFDVVICDPGFNEPLGDLAVRSVIIAETAEEALRFALRVGAREAIAWPRERQLLNAAIESAASRDSCSGLERIGITSARSCGATGFAAHLGASLGRAGIHCLLVDCDLAHADLTGLLLDEAPTTSLEDAVLDGLGMASVTRSVEGFQLIPAAGGRTLSRKGMDALTSWITSRSHPEIGLQVFDLPSAWLSAIADLLPDALSWLDLLIMAVPLDFLGVRRARRIVEIWSDDSRPCLEVLLIQQRRQGISTEGALDVLETTHFGTLPPGGDALRDAIDEGKLLGPRPGTPYAREVQHMAVQVASRCGLADEVTQKKCSRIGSLFDFVASKAASI